MCKKPTIPNTIDNSERIVRVLLSPRHIKKDIIIWNCFRTRANQDEVSVIRIEFCNEQFCKDWGKKIETEDQGNEYYGLAVLLAKEIREIGSSVVFTPSEESHPYHADIQFGYVLKPSETPPPHIKYMMEELATTSRKYKDSQPDNPLWVDGKVC